MDDNAIHVLGIAGSLRKASWNHGLLRAAAELLPDSMTLETVDLSPIPLFNQDQEFDQPEPVQRFKARIAAADALLIATPEYNYSIPGVLKNAIDWASRPPATSPLGGKPLAIMGAGMRSGTIRAQMHLRIVAQSTGMHVLPKPEIYIPMGIERFDAEGNLTDDLFRPMLRDLLAALSVFTRKMRG